MRNSLAYFPDGDGLCAQRACHVSGEDDELSERHGSDEDGKVKTLVVVEGKQDVLAMRKVLAEWPGQVVFCGRAVGESLQYPGCGIETIRLDARASGGRLYRAAGTMPMTRRRSTRLPFMYAGRPAEFQLSQPGTLEVSDAGQVRLVPGGAGKHTALQVDPAKKMGKSRRCAN